MLRTNAQTLTETPPGLVAVDGRAFPLKRAALESHAGAGIAETLLRQSFENPFDTPLEAIYTLPLPADGAVIGYTIVAGGKRIVGEIETREAARQAYQKALEAGHMAGLLEQDRADTFTQSLGSLPPRTPIEVEIRVLHPLAFHVRTERVPAEWEYRFPTVAGVRYEGGPGRVPDRDRLDPPRAGDAGTPVRLLLDLRIADGAPDSLHPDSSSHTLVVTAEDKDRAPGDDAGLRGPCSRVRFEENSKLDRDVTVRWRAAASEVGVRLLEGGGLAGDAGRYALLTIVPPERPASVFPRDLTLLIDASGSMSGPPIESARALGERLLRSLSPQDRFEILAFAETVRKLVPEPLLAAPENVEKGCRALAGLRAGGATEMAGAIEKSLRPLRREAQRQVVLVTDGYIGFESEVIRNILDHLPPGARLHVVGIGSAPNRALTRPAGRAGRGIELILTDPADTESVAERLLAATRAPVLTDLTISGSAVLASAPERPADVFEARPLMAALELSAQGGEIRIEGRLSGSREAWAQELSVTAMEKRLLPGLPIGAFFGRETIEDLETRFAAGEAEVESLIETCGLRHRIPSRRTSLVAIAEEPAVDPTQPRRRERLAVEVPAGVSAEACGLGAVRGMPPGGVAFAETALFSLSSTVYDLLTPSLPRHSRKERAVPPPNRARRIPQPPEPVYIQARVTRIEGDLLVLEFESNEDGFYLPDAGSKVTLGRLPAKGIVEGGLSTSPGPHPAGLTLRLALRTVDGSPWMQGLQTAHWIRKQRSVRLMFEVV